MHPRNVVLHEGRLVGLIDWGDVCAGDRATDLAGAWFLVHARDERRRLLRLCGADEDEIRRALGWALHLSLAHAEGGDAAHARIVSVALERVLQDA